METTPQVLLATLGTDGCRLTADLAEDFARHLRCPSLVVHGDADPIAPLARGTELARLAGSELLVLPGTGHEPECRIPERMNPALSGFLASVIGDGR
jgi:proline iminopeptidase